MVRIYAISDDGKENIVKESEDNRCIAALMSWIVGMEEEQQARESETL